MIERLSDDVIKQIANDMTSENTVPAFKAGIIQGLIKYRSIYDAQIDAQAKTMEELLEIYKECRNVPTYKDKQILKNKIEDWMREKNWHLNYNIDEYDFADGVMMFLAAGGTIKE